MHFCYNTHTFIYIYTNIYTFIYIYIRILHLYIYFYIFICALHTDLHPTAAKVELHFSIPPKPHAACNKARIRFGFSCFLFLHFGQMCTVNARWLQLKWNFYFQFSLRFGICGCSFRIICCKFDYWGAKSFELLSYCCSEVWKLFRQNWLIRLEARSDLHDLQIQFIHSINFKWV